MNWRSSGVVVAVGVLLLAACGTGSRSASGPASGDHRSPHTEKSGAGASQPSTRSSSKAAPAKESPRPGARDRTGKPTVDQAKASPRGFDIRYLKDGTITELDVPDFER